MALASVVAMMAQVRIPYNEINYNAHYHWGLVDVMIGHGKITLSQQGNELFATFDGNTIPWDGRVYCISDTLRATFTPGYPLSQETVTYENGWYMKPKVSAYRGGTFDPADPANYKNIKGEGGLDVSDQTMEAIVITADMLGLFYYYKEIDFENMPEGRTVTIPINVVDGESQSVTITYNGKSSVDAGGVTYSTYSTVFEYTYNGVPSGYPVNAEVDVDSRIPVMLSASLPIGKVELIYD